MEITLDELVAEAGQMALEIRLKDKTIASLKAQVAEQAKRLTEPERNED